MVVDAKNKWWWVDSYNNNNDKLTRSPWLQSTLSDLDEKTKAMLKLIEEDADSFAQRAEMYYKKRPELMTMVEEFYRSHRSLAEQYDQVKYESGIRHTTPWGSPLCFTKYKTDKVMSSAERSYDSFSETYEHEECDESEVDDPDQEEESKCNEVVEDDDEEILREIANDEVQKLKEELDKLKEENKLQQEQLMQKDEEKKEAIRQLSFAVDMLKEDNVKLRKMVAAKESPKKQKNRLLELNKFNGMFWGKLFNGSSKAQKIDDFSLELIATTMM